MHYVIVGYKTRLAENAKALMPEFAAPANYKDPLKITEYIGAKQLEWLTDAKNQPYAGTLDQVCISIPSIKELKLFTHAPSKLPVCVRVQKYLIGLTRPEPPNVAPLLPADTWPDTAYPPPGPPKAVFIGFNPRGFLKMLGLECALPANASKLPLSMWYGGNDHYRDIAEVILPRECGDLPIVEVLKRRGIPLAEGWAGPGADAVGDVTVTTMIACQIGFYESVFGETQTVVVPDDDDAEPAVAEAKPAKAAPKVAATKKTK